MKGCNDNCQCLWCENPYGKKAKTECKSYSTETSKRKRRPQGMTTETMSGKHFLLKRPCWESVSRWTLLEELALIQIVQSSLTVGGSDIDIDVIAMQYSQLVDCSGIHPKSQAQISGKVISFLNDNRVYKALLNEQVRLNWFS